MKYEKNKSAVISFPLGGIGAGSIGLAGNGSLVDWEIFNRPSKCSRNGFTHFAVRAEEEGKVTGIRILNGDLPPPYIGEHQEKPGHAGFGYGPAEETLANWPHFPEHEFSGNYPVAEINFKDDKFPGKNKLSAWSVMIPGESMDSSLPAAFFEVELTNTTNKTIDYTVIGVLGNPWCQLNSTYYNKVEKNQLTVYSGDGIGDVTLTLDEAQENIWNDGIRRQDAQAMSNKDMLIIHKYAGTANTAVFAERYSSCAVEINSLGGDGGGNLGMPITVTYGGVRTIGTVSVSDGGFTFTPDDQAL
jgi:uncharacterized protein (DUF608 family)